MPKISQKNINEESNKKIIIAATPDWGGFITLLGEGKLQAIIDDRNTLLGESFYRNFFDSMQPGPRAELYLKELGANYILLSAQSKLGESLIEQGLAKEIVRDDLAWGLEIVAP